MSLTRILKSNSDVSREFHEIFNEFNFNVDKLSEKILSTNIKARFILKDYRLAGITGGAFDYLSRFVIAKNQFKITKRCPSDLYNFTAKIGLNILIKYTSNKSNNYNEVYSNGLALIREYVEEDKDCSKELFKRIIGVSVYFAKLEQMYRSGYKPELENSLKYKIEPSMEQELINQITIMEEAFKNEFQIHSVANNINYNPHFGDCSIAVGGADADIVINNVLVDFKTTKNLSNIKNDLEQVFFYYLFSEILTMKPSYRSVYSTPLFIDTISLYYARYGTFVTYTFTEQDKKKITSSIKRLMAILHL